MSTRATIMAALKTALESISIVNGFQTDVATVKRGAFDADSLKPRPALCLYCIELETEDLTCAQLEQRLMVGIDGYVDGDQVNGPADLDALWADVIKALLDKTNKYNTYWATTHITGCFFDELFDGSRPLGFGLEVQVKYQHNLAEP